MIKKSLFTLILAGLALLALLLGYFSTFQGTGVGGDATIYISSAQNLLDGKGLGLIEADGQFRLLPYFPPGFSLALSALGLFGLDLTEAARWLNILLFAALVWLAGYATWKFSKNFLPAVFVSLILLLSPVLIPVFSWAMSEPLALFCGFLSLVLISKYLNSSYKSFYLILSAAAGAAAFLTRYSAVAFIAAGVLALLFISKGRKRKAVVRDILLYGIIGILPLGIWAYIDYSQTANFASRSVESSMGMFERFVNFWPQLKQVFLFWFLPESLFYAPPYPLVLNQVLLIFILLVLVVFFAGMFFWLMKKVPQVRENYPLDFLLVLGFFVIAYLAVILFVYVTTYPPITIGSRMLSPVHLAVLWMTILLIAALQKLVSARKWLVNLLTVGLVLFTLVYAVRSLRIVQQNYEVGLGYNSLAWQNSDTIEALLELPQDTPIVSNETNAVFYLTGRAAYPLMEVYYDKGLSQFTAFGQGDLTEDEGQRLFVEAGAPLVLFDTIDEQMSGLYGGQTDARISALVSGLFRAYRGEDGGIFYYQEP